MYAIVILVGGKGSRVSKILKNGSKPEIEINKKKIIDYQLKQINNLNKKIFFLSNTKFYSLKKYLKKKLKNNSYQIFEEKKPLGTAGCLIQLTKLNYKFYLVIDGDLIFNINFKKLINFHVKKKSICTLLVHPNNHPYDSDCVDINKDKSIKKFFFKPHKKKFINNLCLSGIKIVNKDSLKIIKKNKFQDFSKDFLKKYKNKNRFFAYNTREYIKDAGTPERIREVKKDLINFKYKLGNLNKKIPAIFLDKDGVINTQKDNQHYQNPIKILPGVYESIKKINDSGYMCILVTNQPAVAKGFITLSKLKSDLNLLIAKFGDRNAYFDRVYYCPHYPIKGFIGENKEFKIKCNCRKPGNGMFLKAISELNINIKKSFMIGDSYSDLEAAKKTKIKFIKIGEKKFPSNKNYIIKKNLTKAVNYILK